MKVRPWTLLRIFARKTKRPRLDLSLGTSVDQPSPKCCSIANVFLTPSPVNGSSVPDMARTGRSLQPYENRRLLGKKWPIVGENSRCHNLKTDQGVDRSANLFFVPAHGKDSSAFDSNEVMENNGAPKISTHA
jgi:hypothetical protein